MKKLSSGAALESFDRLDSTSAEARRRAEAGEEGPLWIVAHNQTGGYGRLGRAWESGTGNFAGTFLFAPQADSASLGQLSFVAALSALEVLDVFAREEALSLKWPNDVLAGGEKIAGILLERVDRGDRPIVAVGVGVNLVSAPTSLPYSATSLGACLGTGRSIPTPDEFVRRLDESLNVFYRLWRERGMEIIRPAWLERAAGLGETIRVRLPKEEFSGVFAGLDETGALIVSSDGKQRLVTAGEVMFGDPAP